MSERMKMHRRVLQVVVCAALSWCVVPRASMAAPQCAEFNVSVPSVIGQTVDGARGTLDKVGLKLGTVNPPNGTGVVFRQNPEPKQCVLPQASVDIWIKDASTVEVPDLRGQSPLEAVFVLAMRGLRPGGSSREQSNQVAPGKILNQQPAAGTQVPKGTAVVVTLAEAVTVLPPSTRETLTLKSNLNGPAKPGELVAFVATAQGPAHSTQFQFDFGDGQKSPTSNSPQASHAYEQDGNYTATVTAILDGGVGQVTASTDISVHEAPQVVTLDVRPRTVDEKQPVTFIAHVYPPEPAPLLYTFQFGDKSEKVSETPRVTHPYERSAVYQPLVTILTAHKHKASSNPVQLIVVERLPVPWWLIVLVVAAVVALAAFVGVVGHKLLQQGVTRWGIRSNLRPGGVTVRLQAAHESLEEDEFQFHMTHSAGMIVVPAQASVVRSVEVRK